MFVSSLHFTTLVYLLEQAAGISHSTHNAPMLRLSVASIRCMVQCSNAPIERCKYTLYSTMCCKHTLHSTLARRPTARLRGYAHEHGHLQAIRLFLHDSAPSAHFFPLQPKRNTNCSCLLTHVNLRLRLCTPSHGVCTRSIAIWSFPPDIKEKRFLLLGLLPRLSHSLPSLLTALPTTNQKNHTHHVSC